ncbi:MAG: Rrf2 family transcriptional regulator [Rhodospirillales bacterium]|nr:Rrf2 family transcriptional regulator [Rhodospirillales bacterium]
MRLTDRTDYAFRVLIYLAVSGGRLATAREIAEHYDISRNHVARVAWDLGRAGIVETVRGRRGGLRLARPAETITVGAVARCTERMVPLAECFPGGAGDCRIAPACRYRTMLAEAQDAFFAVLNRYSVHDLVNGNPGLRELISADPP